MNMKFQNSAVDEIGMKILKALLKNARSTFSRIGKSVGLSSPAVAERVYKMEEAGIIKGYHADISAGLLDHALTAFITLTTKPDKYDEIFNLAQKEKHIIECHHVSGGESLIFRAGVPSVNDLEKLVEKLSRYGETKSNIVLSTPVQKTVQQLLK